MFAKLTALVSGSNTLPYELDDAEGEKTAGGWRHHRAKNKSDKTPVSLFKFSFSQTDDPRKTEAAKHGIKSLRTVPLDFFVLFVIIMMHYLSSFVIRMS